LNRNTSQLSKRNKSRRLWLCAVILLVAAAASVVLVWPGGSLKEITHPFIARDVQDKIGKIFQASCSVRGAWVSFQALRMRAVVLKKAVAPQCTLEVRAPRVTVTYRLVPLIRNFRAIMRSIDYYAGDSISGVKKNLADDQPFVRPYAPHRYFPIISGVLFRKAEVALIREGKRTVVCKGVDFRFKREAHARFPGKANVRILAFNPGNGFRLDSVSAAIRVLWGTGTTLPPSQDFAPSVPLINLDLRAPVMTVQNVNTFHRISAHMTVVPGRDASKFFPAGSLKNQQRLSRTTQLKMQLDADRLFVDRRYRIDRITAFAGFDGATLGIDSCRAHFGEAPLLLSARYDVPSNRLRYCAIDVSGVDLHKFYAMSGNAAGYIAGKADIALNLKPGPLDLDSVSGYAIVRGANLVARNLPIQNTKLLRNFLPGLSSVAFSLFNGEIKFGKGHFALKSFSAYGNPLSIIASGWANDRAAMQMRLFGILSAGYAGGLKELTRESLEPMGSGSYAFRCRVGGTFREPEVELDKMHIRRATKATLERFGRAILQVFGKKSAAYRPDNLPVIEEDVCTY
jgi:hypothetical protein